MTHYNVTDIVDRLRNFALNTLALIPDKLQQYPKTDPDLIIKGFSHQCDLLTEAADTIATLRKQLENAREAEEIASLRDYITNAPPAPPLAAQDGLVEALLACVSYIQSPLKMSSDLLEDRRRSTIIKKALSAIKGDKS